MLGKREGTLLASVFAAPDDPSPKGRAENTARRCRNQNRRFRIPDSGENACQKTSICGVVEQSQAGTAWWLLGSGW